MVRETQALSASARQLTPQADERGIRLVLPAGIRPCPLHIFNAGPARHGSGAGAPIPPPPPPPPVPPPARDGGPRVSPAGPAPAAAAAPPEVQRAIWPANQI